jgi:hypothetical protein
MSGFGQQQWKLEDYCMLTTSQDWMQLLVDGVLLNTVQLKLNCDLVQCKEQQLFDIVQVSTTDNIAEKITKPLQSVQLKELLQEELMGLNSNSKQANQI